jgi:hypothetical protein
MLPIKNNVLPQSNNIKNMFTAIIDLSNCLKMKCKIEQEQLKKSKIYFELEKLMLNFQENLKNGKADYKKFNNEVAKLKIKAMKEEERKELVKCQLKSCYNETLHIMKITLESYINNGDKNSKEYKLALKYKKILDANKLTAENLNKLETEMIKIKLNKM